MNEALPCQSPSGPENSHWCIQVTIMQSESIGRKEVQQEDSNVTLIEFSVNVSQASTNSQDVTTQET